MAVVWAVVVALGLAVAAWSSAHAVAHALQAAAGLGVAPFVVGFTLLAFGTDVPEMANSIAASVRGHGDINVGDSIGSAAAQATLVVGLVPFAARGFRVTRRNVVILGGLTVTALLLGVALMADGRLGRGDGAVLVVAWVAAVAYAGRRVEGEDQPELPLPARRIGVHVAMALALLGVVGVGATTAVTGLTRLAAELAAPEYLVSFVGLALGTSLPELTVAVAAARRRQGALALGDALGASLADASLSVGIGPLIAPTAVTASLVVRGGLLTAAAVGAAAGILVAAGTHNRATGFLLVLTYAAVLPLLLGAVG